MISHGISDISSKLSWGYKLCMSGCCQWWWRWWQQQLATYWFMGKGLWAWLDASVRDTAMENWGVFLGSCAFLAVPAGLALAWPRVQPFLKQTHRLPVQHGHSKVPSSCNTWPNLSTWDSQCPIQGQVRASGKLLFSMIACFCVWLSSAGWKYSSPVCDLQPHRCGSNPSFAPPPFKSRPIALSADTTWHLQSAFQCHLYTSKEFSWTSGAQWQRWISSKCVDAWGTA